MVKMRVAQRGMGMSAIMFVVVVVVFTVTMLLKLGPSYMTFMTMKSLMDGIAESPEPIQGGRTAIMRTLESRMMVNDVRTVDPKAITVKKSGDNTLDVTLAYEQRIHLFANIDAVLVFDHKVVVKGQ